jgi:tetratricopeptide (TPR) repeat protein
MVAAKLPLGLAALLVLGLGLASADDDLKKEALALNDITGDEPIEAKFQELIAKPAQSKKLLAAAAELAKEKKDPFTYTANYILARAGQELKEVKTSETFYHAAADQAVRLKSGQKMVQAYGGLMDLYFENKMFDETTKVCQKFLELPDDETIERIKPAVFRRLVQAMARQGKFEDALKLVDPRVDEEGKKDGWWWLQLKASVLREADRLDDAAKAYETVVERIEKDKTLREEARDLYLKNNRYYLSGVYVDMKQIDKAADILKALLKADPDNSTFNNDLGYIWADHDMNLDEAEKLIRKALEEDQKQRKAIPNIRPEDDKDNGAYLDSLGWVLFKKKQYEEAKKYLLRAIEDKESQHIEIYDHLGDVYEALSDKPKALDAYKKGVELAGKSKREQDRKAKVEEKIKKLQ